MKEQDYALVQFFTRRKIFITNMVLGEDSVFYLFLLVV